MSATDIPTDFPIPSDESLLAGDYKVDLGSILSDAFNLLMKDIGLHIVAAIIYIAVFSFTCGLGALLAGPLMAGFTIMAMKRMKGQPVDFNDIFAGFKLFVPLFLLTLVMGFGILVGTMLCILPGIYLSIAWTFGACLIIDRKMDFWSAAQFSMQVVNKQFWPVAILVVVLGVIMTVGNSIVIGALFTTPLWSIAIAVAYARIFGLQPGPVVE